MALHETNPLVENKQVFENKLAAYFNWELPNKSGEIVVRGARGFKIYDSKTTSTAERKLLKLAEQNGGEVELTMKITVRLFNAEAADAAVKEVDLADFI